jgi:hypothetical protein
MKQELNQKGAKLCCSKPNGKQIQAKRTKSMLAAYYQTCGVHLRTTEKHIYQVKLKLLKSISETLKKTKTHSHLQQN